MLSKENGNLHDYGYVDILTHPDAQKDHFIEIIKWIKFHQNNKFEQYQIKDNVHHV